MRISDWSSDVCSSDLSFTSYCASIGVDPPKPMLLPAIRLASGRALDVSLRYSTPTTKAPGVAAIGTVNGRSPVTKPPVTNRSEEHTSELQSLMRISYAVFCFKKKKQANQDSNQQVVNK